MLSKFQCSALALLASSLLVMACAKDAGNDLKQVEVTEANRDALQERIRAGRDLTGEEVRLLDAYLERQGTSGRLPVGRRIGELLAEQRGFEQAKAAEAGQPPSQAALEPEAERASPATPVPQGRRIPIPPPSTAPPEAGSSEPSAETAPPLTAPERPAPPRPTPVPDIVVPAGTALEVRLEEPVSTKTHDAGQRFEVSLSDDLVVSGRLVARRGARLTGRVVESVRSGKVKGRARMSLALTALARDGADVEIESEPLHFEAESSKGKDAKKVGIGAVAGAVVGAVKGGKKGAVIGTIVGAGAGGGVVLLTRGEEVEFAVEQAFEFRLARALRLRPLDASR
jgi:hypothetical protein